MYGIHCRLEHVFRESVEVIFAESHFFFSTIFFSTISCSSFFFFPSQTFDCFDESQRKTLQELTTLLDPSSSFKNYREALRASVGPCVPYLYKILFFFFFWTDQHTLIRGATLTDLTFAEDGNPDTVSAKDSNLQLINFSKRELICQIVSTVQNYQGAPYSFPVVEPIHTFLRELPSLDEKSLYALSLRLETRKQTTTPVQSPNTMPKTTLLRRNSKSSLDIKGKNWTKKRCMFLRRKKKKFKSWSFVFGTPKNKRTFLFQRKEPLTLVSFYYLIGMLVLWEFKSNIFSSQSLVDRCESV